MTIHIDLLLHICSKP